jgi:dihydrodipicolinate synthase/N-acetylneuraminate lyase
MLSDSNCFPELYVELFDLFNNGKYEEARKLQFAINDFLRKTPKTDNGESAAEEKYVLSKRGVIGEYVNPAYRTLSSDEKAIFDKALKEFGFKWA